MKKDMQEAIDLIQEYKRKAAYAREQIDAEVKGLPLKEKFKRLPKLMKMVYDDCWFVNLSRYGR